VYEDLSAQAAGAREAALERAIKEDSVAPFDLSVDLMLRARLLKLGPAEHALVLVMHHIASDGVSVGVFCQELTQAYAARSVQQSPQWSALEVSYADYAAWQREWLEGSGALKAQSESWQKQLAGIPELLGLPVDFARAADRSREAGYHPIQISAPTARTLQSLANAHQTTVFTVLIALFGTLLGRLANQTDVVIGSPVAGRSSEQVDGLVGFFVNTLALRVDSSGHPDLHSLIERTKQSVTHALAHQDLPFERLVEDLGVSRSLSHTPVFQAMLAWHIQDAPSITLEGLTLEPIKVASNRAKYDLTLYLVPESNGEIRGLVEYDSSLFDNNRIAQWAQWFVHMLDHVQMLEQTLTPVDTVSLLNAVSQSQANHLGNKSESTDARTLDTLFAQQVMRTPDAVALVFEDLTLTYRELDGRANQLARHLISSGVGPEYLVALALPRSLELIIALLAIIKTGAGYLPLDPGSPANRLTFMLSDSRANVIIKNTDLVTEVMGELHSMGHQIRSVDLDDSNLQRLLNNIDDKPIQQSERIGSLEPNCIAYLIYTSGSTGVPKGVANTHRNVVRLLSQTEQWFDFKADDVWTLFHSIAFDFSVWEIWGALAYGGKLVVVSDNDRRSPSDFLQLIHTHGVTVLNQTPTAFEALASHAVEQSVIPDSLSLRYVIFGGAALNPAKLTDWHARFPLGKPMLINMYGITETTVHVTYRPIIEQDLQTDASPIGLAIPDLTTYVLDAALQPLPAGMTGEMYVAGPGLARGYFGRTGLTAERFIADPFEPGQRMYRTGDLGRWTESGDLEYFGRADQQVKIRGFRIELGEIEAALVAIPGVSQCTVQVRGEESAKQLIAYLVSKDGQKLPSAEHIKEKLKERLPDYMIPVAFVSIK
jgi:nonribosomal peptide synthetase DhbF